MICRHRHNPKALCGQPCPDSVTGVLPSQVRSQAREIISAWSGYTPTALRPLDALARELGVAEVYYKDESSRFDLASFKALGGAYAVQLLLCRIIGDELGRVVTPADIDRVGYPEQAKALTVVTATDGNHGRSVAWGAQRFGCECEVYMHEQVSPGRQRAVEAYGARVHRVKGNYDDSVRQAAADARRHGWHVVSDTSWPGYVDIPRSVMAGYTMMTSEVMGQWPHVEPPTHVFIQGGCGGLAGAVCQDMWSRLGVDRPRFIVVEPEPAACLFESACAGAPRMVDITTETLMAGLSCGEVSLLAWPVLEPAVDHFLTMTDDQVPPLMRRLAQEESIVAGESAIAGLAGLIGACADGELAECMDLSSHSRVLLLGTEGATDQAVYDTLVR